MIISSYKNSKVKELRSLYKKKYQRKEGKIILEGLRIIEDALREGVSFYRVFYADYFLANKAGADLIENFKEQGIETYQLSADVVNRVSDVQNSQGILAVVKRPEYDLDDLEIAQKQKMFLVLDGLQDPGNLGTILRTADAAGVDGVLMTKGTVNLYNQKVIRATMGSLFRVPGIYIDDIKSLEEFLYQNKVKLFVADLGGDKLYYEADYTANTALVIGNEAHGPSAEVKNLADCTITLPIVGGAESLNAAMAAGIITYEALKQRLDNNNK